MISCRLRYSMRLDKILAGIRRLLSLQSYRSPLLLPVDVSITIQNRERGRRRTVGEFDAFSWTACRFTRRPSSVRHWNYSQRKLVVLRRAVFDHWCSKGVSLRCCQRCIEDIIAVKASPLSTFSDGKREKERGDDGLEVELCC
jgi:hypothetical protein